MFTRRRKLLYLALLIATLVALRVQWSRLQDPYTIQDDFRKFHWMRRYEDPELFTDDPLTSPTEIQLGPVRFLVDETRPGYTLLFFLASPVFPPVLFNKLLIFPLLLISVYFLFRIGEVARDEETGFTFALSFIVLTTLWTSETSVAAGLPRSFMAPILLGIVYFLMIDRYWMACGVAMVAATIYWPGALLGIVTITLATIEPTTGRWRYRISWRRILPLVALLAVLLLISPLMITRLKAVWDNLLNLNLSFDEALNNPNYTGSGRWRLFRDFPFQGLGALSNNFMNLWLLVVLTPLSIAIQLLRPQAYKLFPRALKLLFGASVILYALSWLAYLFTSSLLLYFPSRYTQTSLPLVLLFFVIMNLGPAMRVYWARFRALGHVSRLLTIAVSVITAVALYFLLGQNDLWNRLGAIRVSFRGILLAAYMFLASSITLLILSRRSVSTAVSVGARLAPRKEYSILLAISLAALVLFAIPPDDSQLFVPIEQPRKDLVDFFQTLPKDSLTAGSPCVLDYVPMAAGRQVLFSCEFYTTGRTDTALANFRAYFADSLSQVREFCEAYGVDYLAVTPQSFDTSENMWVFFEPVNSILIPEILAKPGYVLQDIPASMRLYEGQDTIVMDCAAEDIGRLESQAAGVDGLGILTHTELPETVSQASNIELVIKWVAEKELTSDYDLCFSLKDESGQSRQRECVPLSPNLPTSQWQIPEIRYETYNFQISPYLESGDYTIVAAVDSGEDAGDDHEIVLGEIIYSAQARTFGATDHVTEADDDLIWGDAIALDDFTVSGTESDSLQLALRWFVLKRMTSSYKVFTHVRKADSGEIVSQSDAIPRNWTYPTNWWEAGEIIDDTMTIPLEGLGSGRYELWIGFYDEESGERLSLSSATEVTSSMKDGAARIYEFER